MCCLRPAAALRVRSWPTYDTRCCQLLLLGALAPPPPPPADAPLELCVSTFEVLTGAAPGWELRLAPWALGSPPPPGAVVVGVSSRGDPLLAGLAEQIAGGRRRVALGYTSVREASVMFPYGGGVESLPW
jgi:hypothetical protein